MNFMVRLFTDESKMTGLPVDTKKRIPYLVYTAAILIVFFLFSATLKYLADTETFRLFAILVGFTTIGFLVSLFMIRAGKYEPASFLTISCLFLNLQWMGFALPVSSHLDSYKYLAYELATIIVVALVSFRANTMIIYGLACTAGLVVLNLTVIAASENGLNQNVLTVMVLGVILLITVTMVSVQSARFNAQLVALAKQEEIRSQDRFIKLKKLIADSHESFEIGRIIKQSSDTSLQRSKSVEMNAKSIHELMRKLADSSLVTAKASQGVLVQTALMRKAVSESHEAISSTSAGVTEIMTTISSIADSAKHKRANMAELLKVMDGQRTEIEQVRQSMRVMVDSSRQFATIIASITDIAEQTSLLAMNASIEAAHAGESGKGFAVIANQVKQLSESARQSTGQVSAILASNGSAMEKGARLIEGTVNFFARLDEQVKMTVNSIEEILEGLSEIARGTDEIHQSSARLVSLSASNAEMVGKVEVHTHNTDQESTQLTKASHETLEAIDGMLLNLGVITKALQELSESGTQNILSLDQLNSGITAISSNG